MKTFQGYGIRFDYLPNWQLSADVGEERTDITVFGPGTALWIVSVVHDRPSSDDLVTETVGTFRDEYPSCDLYDSNDTICMLPTVAKDLDFIHHDLISRVCIRACEGDVDSLLLIYQVSDVESEELLPILKHMADSLMFDEESRDTDRDEDFEVDDDDEASPLYWFQVPQSRSKS